MVKNHRLCSSVKCLGESSHKREQCRLWGRFVYPKEDSELYIKCIDVSVSIDSHHVSLGVG